MRIQCAAAIALAAACAPIALEMAAEAATFTKGPYLQGLSSDAVVIKFECDSPSTATLAIVDAATNKAISVESKAPESFHALHAEGLSPSTSYSYTVTLAGSAKPPESGHFTTAPIDARAFHFIVYGDSRSDEAAHASVIRAMSERPADFLVNTGDLVYRGSDPKEWETFFRIEGKTLRDRCVFATIGNHELNGGKPGAAAFERYFGLKDEASDADDTARLYGSTRWGNTRFFFLNAMDEFNGGAERAWLEQALTKADGEPGLAHRIAVLHHGPFSSGPHRGNPKLGTLVAWLRDHRIDLVLAGHDHIYERGEGAGLKYVISGGAGAPLYPRETTAPETQSFESVHHFVEVTIDGDRLSIVARRAVGSVIEACSYSTSAHAKSTPWACDSPAQSGATPPSPDSDKRSKPHASSCGCRFADEGDASPALAIVAGLLGLCAARRRAATLTNRD